MACKLHVAGLFAGIGGFERGLGAAGHETVLLCEVWAPAKAVLAEKFPDVPLHDDVRDLARLPDGVDLVAAGFPCQDLSQAGRTAGIDGSKSGLVAEVFRLLAASKVDHVLIENVSFMLSLAGGRAMHQLTRNLRELGYRWAYRTIDTQAFLPQRRERVFLLASRSDLDPAAVLFGADAAPPAIETRLDTHAHGFYWTEGNRGLGWAPDAVPTLKNGSTVGIPSPPAIAMPTGGIIKPDIRDAERLQGFDADWTKAAEAVGRATLRWSLVGNAVSIPVAHWIGERLADPGPTVPVENSPLAPDDRWPRAAVSDGAGRRAVRVGRFPHWRPRAPLATFLAYAGTPLSARATYGFGSRYVKSSLRKDVDFLERLEAHYRERCTAESVSAQPFGTVFDEAA